MTDNGATVAQAADCPARVLGCDQSMAAVGCGCGCAPCLRCRQSWDGHRQRTGVDLTCGLSDVLVSLLAAQVSGSAVLRPPPQYPPSRWTVPERVGVKETVEEYTRLSSLSPLWAQGLDGRILATSGYNLKDGEYHWFCNQKWALFFLNQRQVIQRLKSDCIMPLYIMAGWVSEQPSITRRERGLAC